CGQSLDLVFDLTLVTARLQDPRHLFRQIVVEPGSLPDKGDLVRPLDRLDLIHQVRGIDDFDLADILTNILMKCRRNHVEAYETDLLVSPRLYRLYANLGRIGVGIVE